MRSLLLLLALRLAAPAAEWKLIVGGLGGEPDYEARFTDLTHQADKLISGTGEALAGKTATKDAIKAALDRMAAQTQADDVLHVLLIGHGAWDGLVYKFNLPGLDISADELATWLDAIPCRQVVVLATSSSGGAVPMLKSPRRVVVAATKSGTEKNAVVFSRYWVEALREASADTDKNESTSVAEAFRYAQKKTADYYESQKRLATEHPQIEDPEKGLMAARTTAVRYGTAQQLYNRPEKKFLLDVKEKLERQIDELKLEKAAMPVAEYKQRLAALLTQLASLQEEIEK